jgi:Membrane bound beta barrel domain (DUF5777)
MATSWVARVGLAFVCVMAGARVSAQTAPASPPPAVIGAATAGAPQAQADDDDRRPDRVEPDFALVNLPTTLRLPRHGLNFRLTHRFLGNLRSRSFTENLENLFGLDNGAVVGLELRYSPVRRVQTILHRTTADRTIQLVAQYDGLRQGASSPVSISALLSVEGAGNFGERYSPAIGATVSRKAGTRLGVYAVPVWVHNTAALLGDDRDTFFVGLGGRLRLTPRVYVVGEVSPRTGGYAPGEAEFAFGIEKRVGGHVFLLTLTNTTGTTFGQTARGGLPDTVYLGFNIGRKFF